MTHFFIPFSLTTGNEDDEGTGVSLMRLWLATEVSYSSSLSSLLRFLLRQQLTLSIIQNVTSQAGFDNFVRTSIPGLNEAQFARLKELYPTDPSLGEPYGTGDAFNLTGFNKAVASLYGDYVFQNSRRSLLSKIVSSSKNAGVYSYLHSTFKSTPLLGAYHSSELANTCE